MRTHALALAAAIAAATLPSASRAHLPRSGPYSLEIVDESGAVLPTFRHSGRTYVLGTLGRRYLVRVRNGSPRRAEVVVSVDGRDVLDGRPSAFEKRGYLVDAYGEVVIDGYRLSDESVAAFRFSSVPRSYSAQMGDARDVGVIGVAVFQERPPVYVAPAPYPPRWELDRGEARAESKAADSTPPSEPLASGAEPAPAKAKGGPALRAPIPQRPGLGTEFGEEHESRVTQVFFERASQRPDAVLTVRYDDRQGLAALGIDVDGHRAGDPWLRESADPFRRNASYSEPPPGWRSR